MIRRFNYTRRRTIPQRQVDVSLQRGSGRPMAYEARFDFQGIELPDDASVWVEAYSRFGFMRFSHGTVGRLRTPADTSLVDLHGAGRIQFRLKVIDGGARRGQLLAVADRLSPRDPSEAPGRRQPLLPVENIDLGEQVWAVDCSGDEPILQLNVRIPGIDAIARNSPLFGSLVFPAVLREVLEWIVIVENHAGIDEEDHAYTRWLRFASRFAGTAPPEAEETEVSEKSEWVDAAVRGFSSWYKARDRFEAAFDGSAEE